MKNSKLRRFCAMALGLMLMLELVFTSVIPGLAEETANNTATAEKQLISFNECEVGKNFTLPDNMEILSGSEGNTYDGTQSIIETASGDRTLQIALNKKANAKSGDTITKKDVRIAFKVSVPVKYVKYLDSIHLDVSCNAEQTNSAQTKMYYLLGITDDTNYGKAVAKASAFPSTGETVRLSESMSDMLLLNKIKFLGSTSSSDTEKWSAEQISGVTDILVYITLPKLTGREGYTLEINGVGITIKGNKEEIDNIDILDPYIAGFDEADTIEGLKELTGLATATKGDFSLTASTVSEPNAFLYKGTLESGTDYDAYFNLKLDQRASMAEGIEFYVRNLDAETALSMRVYLIASTKNGTVKYQVIKTVAKDTGEYTRIRIYFNEVGATGGGGDEFSSSSSTGKRLTDEEIVGLTTLRVRIPNIKTNHAGVAFDSFKYIPLGDKASRAITAVDFDNCEKGELPDGISVTGYAGKKEVVTHKDGSRSLRINYNVASTKGNTDKINERSYVAVTIPVPKGSAKYLSEIMVDITNNAVTPDNTYTGAQNIYYLITVSDGETYGRRFMSRKVPAVGKTATSSLATEMMFRVSSHWNLLNWFNETGVAKWTPEEISGIESVTIYITAPVCDGTEGWSVDLDSVKFVYSEIPAYEEEETRYVVNADRMEALESDTISLSQVELLSTNPNYRNFSTAFEINTLDPANTAPAVIRNGSYNFLRNLTPFTETATLFMFARSDKAVTLKMGLVSKSGDVLPFTVELPAATDALYAEYEISIAEVLKACVEENPDFTFNGNDIYAISILPVAETASTVNISCLSVWSKEVGEATDSNSWYYYNNGVAVEAYNDYLVSSDEVEIEGADVASQIKSWGIELPSTATPLIFKTVTIYNKDGGTIEPKGKIWLTFDMPENTDYSDIDLYRVYFDGSLLEARYVVEGNGISINTFTVGSFLIVKNAKTVIDETPEELPDETPEALPVPQEPEQTYEELTPGEESAGETTEVVVTKKKMMRRKKKQTADTDYTLWIVLAAVGAVVVAAGVTVFIILFKKRRKKKGAKAI